MRSRPPSRPRRIEGAGAPGTLVFDLDGTLVDTLADMMAALDAGLAEFGLAPAPLERVMPALHRGADGMLDAALAASRQALKPHHKRLVLASFLHHYEAGLALHSQPFAGVRETLDWHRARGTRMAVCTNKPERMAAALLAALALDDYFAAVVGADTLAVRKPAPAPLWHAIERAGGVRATSAMVGDSAIDLACARAAGVPCLVFSGGYDRVPADAPGVALAFDDWAALRGEAFMRIGSGALA